MRKIAIGFGSALIIINLVGLVVLYFLLRPEDSIPQFTVITADVNDGSRLLEIPRYTLERIESGDAYVLVRGITAEMAVRIAQTVVFDRSPHPLHQSYLVYHDTERDLVIVLAEFIPSTEIGGILRIILCGRTGGVLNSHWRHGGVMPWYD